MRKFLIKVVRILEITLFSISNDRESSSAGIKRITGSPTEVRLPYSPSHPTSDEGVVFLKGWTRTRLD